MCKTPIASVSVLLLLLLASPLSASEAQRLAAAIAIPTVSRQDVSQIDYSQFLRFHQLLRASFPRVFAELKVEVVNGYSLLLQWPGSEPAMPGVLFTAHMDVVPIEPGTTGDWTHPPFAGVVEGGRIYGRGSLDDKQGLMGLLEAAEKLLANGYRPRRTLVLAFGHDEEIGGDNGARALAGRMQELGLHFSWMVDEGGMIITDNPLVKGRALALINVAEKGYLTLTLSARGEGGHSSNPPTVSPIGRLSAALAKLEKNPFPARMVEPVRAMLETLAPHSSQPLTLGNLWLTSGFVVRSMASDAATRAMVQTTTALTMFSAGVKENVIPQRAEAKVNFRLLPGDTTESVLSYVREVIDDPDIEISHDSWQQIPPVADYQGEGFRAIAAAVQATYPDVLPVPSLLTATTDTRHYSEVADNLYRFHGVRMQAGQVTSIHGTNEYIESDSYLKSIAIARDLLQAAGG